MSQWYYAHAGQQKGPVPISELHRLSLNGELDMARDLVWREGMKDWQPASSVPELAPRPGAAEVPAEGAPASAGGDFNPYAAPAAGWNPPVEGPLDLPKVAPANYPLFAITTAIGSVGFAVGLGMFFAATTGGAVSAENVPVRALVVIGLSCIPLLIGTVLSMIYLYRAWLLLQPHTHYSTPGKAVGFLFIPFYNFYWYFVAYWRWAQEWNRLVAFQPRHAAAPRANEGLFLAYAILNVAGLLLGVLGAIPMMIVFFIIMKTVCDAVNYAARGRTGE